MRAAEVKCVELEATEDGILETLEVSAWTDFGEEKLRVYRLWFNELWYRDISVEVTS